MTYRQPTSLSMEADDLSRERTHAALRTDLAHPPRSLLLEHAHRVGKYTLRRKYHDVDLPFGVLALLEIRRAATHWRNAIHAFSNYLRPSDDA